MPQNVQPWLREALNKHGMIPGQSGRLGQQGMAQQAAQMAPKPAGTGVGGSLSQTQGSPAKSQKPGFFSRPDVQAGLLQLIMSKMYGQSTKRSFGDALGAAGRYHSNAQAAQMQQQQMAMEQQMNQLKMLEMQSGINKNLSQAELYDSQAGYYGSREGLEQQKIDADREYKNAKLKLDNRRVSILEQEAVKKGDDPAQVRALANIVMRMEETEVASQLPGEGDGLVMQRYQQRYNALAPQFGVSPVDTRIYATDELAEMRGKGYSDAQIIQGWNAGSLAFTPEALESLGIGAE